MLIERARTRASFLTLAITVVVLSGAIWGLLALLGDRIPQALVIIIGAVVLIGGLFAVFIPVGAALESRLQAREGAMARQRQEWADEHGWSAVAQDDPDANLAGRVLPEWVRPKSVRSRHDGMLGARRATVQSWITLRPSGRKSASYTCRREIVAVQAADSLPDLALRPGSLRRRKYERPPLGLSQERATADLWLATPAGATAGIAEVLSGAPSWLGSDAAMIRVMPGQVAVSAPDDPSVATMRQRLQVALAVAEWLERHWAPARER